MIVVDDAVIPTGARGWLGLEERDGGDVLRIDRKGRSVLFVRGKLPALGSVKRKPRIVLRQSKSGLEGHVVGPDGTLGPAEPVLRIPTGEGVFDRVRGVLETDVLQDRRVAVVGVGSGGSTIAVELAKCGVGGFVLIDHDRLEPGNVSRHVCGVDDVGRRKVTAVAERIRNHNPAARVVEHPIKVEGATLKALRAAVADADVIVCATDNRASRLLVNRVGLILKKPVFFGAVFRRAHGGQVLRVLPGTTPCYQCFIDALPTVMEDQEVTSQEAADRIAYSDRPVAIEPGLSGDVAPVAYLLVKLVLLQLLDGRPTTLDSLRADLVAPLFLWLNRREPGTDYAELPPLEDRIDGMAVLRWMGIALPRNTCCVACGTPVSPAATATSPAP